MMVSEGDRLGVPLGRWRRVGHVATRVLEVAAAAIVLYMVAAILANVISRTFFGVPITGTTEMVGYVWLPAVACLGFVVAQARGQSIEADILFSRLPTQIRREARFFTSSVAAVACLGFAWFGATEAVHALNIGQTAPASDVFIAPVYVLVPFAFGVLVVLFAGDAVAALRGKFDVEHDASEDTDVLALTREDF
ncbi:TRAP transporter small permease [Microbacterium sp. A93]|uniref:TRAP transporter small permease n=1 Tax=Microbacterium sp. A93 TaxID=3450716 RepID=UPI003F441868